MTLDLDTFTAGERSLIIPETQNMRMGECIHLYFTEIIYLVYYMLKSTW